MTAPNLILLAVSAMLAAAGQLLFRYGATGIDRFLGFLNPAILAGIACYGLSTLLWIWVLSRAPLTLVYPFTMLTFMLVYVGAAVLLGERPTLQIILGLCLILTGLAVIASAKSSA